MRIKTLISTHLIEAYPDTIQINLNENQIETHHEKHSIDHAQNKAKNPFKNQIHLFLKKNPKLKNKYK